MKVLHVLGELRPSGAEVMLLEAIPILREHGIESSFLSTGDVAGAFEERYVALGTEVFHLPFERNPSFGVRYVRLVRRERPDIVHIHTERANAALGMLARLAGASVVRTIHSVFTYHGRLRFLRISERTTLRVAGVRHVSIGRAVEANERRHLLNETMRIDNWVAERFRPPTSRERARARAQLGVTDDVIVIASVGNCSMVKNHQAILGALPELMGVTGRNFLYLHAGTGADEGGERELARSLGVERKVRFLGSVRDVRPVLWAADLFCMPSLYEGVSIAALEALACGVPSVLADVEGLRDSGTDGPSVRFVPPDVHGVRNGITDTLYSDAGTLRQAALSASEAVLEARSAAESVEAYARLYEDRLTSPKLKRRLPA